MSTSRSVLGAVGACFCILLIGSSSTWATSVSLLRYQDNLTQSGDLFGAAVAQNNDLLVVTATHRERDEELPREGAAFVYRLENGGLSRVAVISPSDVIHGDENQFGTAAAIFGNVIAIGDSFARSASSPFDDSAGAVYVYGINGTSISQIAKLSEPQPFGSSSEQLGWSVDMFGSLLVAGGLGGENSDGDDVGIVRVYRDNGGWSKIADLQPSFDKKDISPSFGWSVSIGPGFIAVGAPGADLVGAVFVYPVSGDVIGVPTKISARIGARSFGSSVSVFPTVRGTALVIGASGSSFLGVPGAAYYFEQVDEVWQFKQELTPLFVAPEDGYGFSVKALGDCIAVSAPSKTRFGIPGAGEGYLWRYSSGAFRFDQALTAPPQQNGFFGARMALSTRALILGAAGEGRLQDGRQPRGAFYYDLSFNECFGASIGELFRDGFEAR